MKKDISQLRQHYDLSQLSRNNLDSNPFAQFKNWFNEALQSNVLEANIMSLSTVDKSGQPSNRIVLLKELNDEGFVFFTNYESLKSQDINQNPKVSINFLWLEIQKQVCVKGNATKISKELSKEYFQSRPKESQIGAWVSQQSAVIPNREMLTSRQEELEGKYKNDSVLPLPPNWGGYLIKPTEFEFWQGRIGRLHDRFRYALKDDTWVIDRLAP